MTGNEDDMDDGGGVLFGVTETGMNLIALDWAAREAQARQLPLHLVCGHHWSTHLVPWDGGADREIASDLERFATDAIAAATRHVQQTRPGVRVTGRAVDGIAADVLVDRSRSAALTVVGTRHLSTFGGMALGSVSAAVAARAHGAVVVVAGPPAPPGEDGAVVVGIDTDGPDDAVLEFAFDHASRHGRAVHALMCWRPDPLVTARWRAGSPPPDQAQRWLAEALAGWSEKFPQVPLHPAVTRDHAVNGLVSASLGQELLVVGSDNRHPRIGAWLGSVSQGVLHHATCPVAVVHSD